MGPIGAYYRSEMSRMLRGYGCTYCSQEFETNDPADLRYPLISPVCKCTLCRACIDRQCLAQIVPTKLNTVSCPLCRTEQAWNINTLVPNRHLANLLDDMRRVVMNEGKDDCHGGDGGYVNDSGGDDSSNNDDDGGGGGKKRGDKTGGSGAGGDDEEKDNDDSREKHVAQKRKANI